MEPRPIGRGRLAMPEGMEIASFRRITPGILASARLAMANDVPDTSKAEVAVILKKAAPVLGIDGSAYHVMDILLGLSRASDWQGSNRPIVAISNAKLAEYTARSVRQVTRCIRRLVEAGIVAYRDSPTGRRFVYRGKDGDIDKGYGLDFTPARVRIQELKGIVESFQARLKAEQEARRAATRFARAIVDACDAYPERALEWKRELEDISSGPDGQAAGALEELHKRIVNEVTREYVPKDLSSEGDINVSPNINTTTQNSFERNKHQPRSNERDSFPNSSDRGAVARSTEEKNETETLTAASPIALRGAEGTDEVQSRVLASVSVSLIRSACPQASDFVGGSFQNWPELAKRADDMRVAIGLSQAAWTDGVRRAGRYAAAAILVTVLEKALAQPDQISSPGGYFRAMVDRAVDGSLHLEKSLFGLADAALKRDQARGSGLTAGVTAVTPGSQYQRGRNRPAAHPGVDKPLKTEG